MHPQAGAGRLQEAGMRQDPARRGSPEPGRTLSFHDVAVPARCRGPGILLAPVLAAGPRLGLFVPHMVWAERIAGGVGLEARVAPIFIIRVLDELFYPDIERLELGC